MVLGGGCLELLLTIYYKSGSGSTPITKSTFGWNALIHAGAGAILGLILGIGFISGGVALSFFPALYNGAAAPALLSHLIPNKAPPGTSS